ncbi:MAG: SdpI family protein [Verrucomicrobiae bacterium]|nr:SdpI family protein [Verrucomicrobiae bacterium]
MNTHETNEFENPETGTGADETAPGSLRLPLIVSGTILLLLVALSAAVWMRLPDGARVPTHWGPSGKADGFGGKGSLFLLPAVVAGVMVLFALIPRFEPRRGHLLRSSKAYTATWMATLAFFVVLHGAMCWAALGRPLSMNPVIGVATGLLFTVIGNYFGKIRSNFVFGIRTPWTLSSELSWAKTHRLGGRLFMLLGLAIALAGLLDPRGSALMWTVLIGVLGMVAAVFAYSYVVWRRDPGRASG